MDGVGAIDGIKSVLSSFFYGIISIFGTIFDFVKGIFNMILSFSSNILDIIKNVRFRSTFISWINLIDSLEILMKS